MEEQRGPRPARGFMLTLGTRRAGTGPPPTGTHGRDLLSLRTHRGIPEPLSLGRADEKEPSDSSGSLGTRKCHCGTPGSPGTDAVVPVPPLGAGPSGLSLAFAL